MINFYDQVPTIYVSASRDFQYLSWLINIVLNSVKHNVDGLYNLPNTKTDLRLAELLAMTLGFKLKRNYDKDQLVALVSAIPSLLKYKGSLKAVAIAVHVLVAASGAAGDFDPNPESFLEVKNGTLVITLPKTLVDITLLNDILLYILPAGMSCRIIRKDIDKRVYKTEVTSMDYLQAELTDDLTWNADNGAFTGLSTLFTPGSIEPCFENLNENKEVITGLLDNSVIPVLETQWSNDKKEDE